MDTTVGLPAVTSPISKPPISEPRELNERNASTDSRSRRSITLNGIRTATGFCGTSHKYEFDLEVCRSNLSARAVDSIIENASTDCEPLAIRFIVDSTQFSLI